MLRLPLPAVTTDVGITVDEAARILGAGSR